MLFRSREGGREGEGERGREGGIALLLFFREDLFHRVIREQDMTECEKER